MSLTTELKIKDYLEETFQKYPRQNIPDGYDWLAKCDQEAVRQIWLEGNLEEILGESIARYLDRDKLKIKNLSKSLSELNYESTGFIVTMAVNDYFNKYGVELINDIIDEI